MRCMLRRIVGALCILGCAAKDLSNDMRMIATEVANVARHFKSSGSDMASSELQGESFTDDTGSGLPSMGWLGSSKTEAAKYKAGRLGNMQKCYNDLTVLAMLDDKGAFGPDDWHHIFVQMDHGGILGHKTDKGNWRLTQQEFRNGAPNCDSWLFGSMGLANDDSEIDYYEWFDVYESADGCKAPLSGAVMNGGDPGCYGGQDNIMRAEDKPAKFRVTKKMYQDQVPEPGDSSRSRDHLRRKGDTVPKVEPTVDVVSSLKAMAAADPGFKEACEKLSAEQKTALKGSDATKYGECKTAGAAEYTE